MDHNSTPPPATPPSGWLTSNFAPAMAVLALAAVGGYLYGNGSRGPMDFSSAPSSAATSQTAPPLSPVLQSSAANGSSTLTPEMRRDIEALIKDYLLRNPEVMMDVQNALEAKMEKVNAEKMASALKKNAKELFQSPTAPVAGNPKGDVTIVEFFDYNCGYCKKALPDLAALVQSDKNVRVVLKEFPILSAGSAEASKVALAAKMQGKYWDFHLAMLSIQGQANEASALKVAEKVGLDMTRLKKDMGSAEVKKEIDDTKKLAQAMGIQGTPHFLVGDKIIAGAPENLSEMLATQLGDVRKAGGCKVCGG